MAVYVGFDASTQGLSVIAIEVLPGQRTVRWSHALNFDEALPHYGTRHGVLPSHDPLVAASPPLMWAEALDTMAGLFARQSGVPPDAMCACSGSAQQHGSVYLGGSAEQRFAQLDPARPLAEQIRGVFSREVAPIWMDSSTGAQCGAIADAVGGPQVLACLTGSRAFERFTGPQIRKFHETQPEAYHATRRIHLVSSFLASLLAGGDAPLDPGDGSGTNLMDLEHRRWAPQALRATAPDLDRKLPALAPSWTVVGPLAPYWRERHGLPPAKVVAWSGDNPCSLIGVGLVREGRLAISLGTSDTVFGFMSTPRVDPSGTGHVFGAPTGDYMGLTCFKNGSLAREQIRDAYGLDWRGFSEALHATPCGNRGGILLPWFEPEITPPVVSPGVHRYALDPADAAANVRAVVEGQMLAMARHSRWMGVRVDTIHATGGAAANREILQVMADVFDAEVHQLEVGNSAALGAALRAFHADRVAEGHPIAWTEVTDGFVVPRAGSRITPDPAHVARYAELAEIHAACEAHALGRGAPPDGPIERFRARHPDR